MRWSSTGPSGSVRFVLRGGCVEGGGGSRRDRLQFGTELGEVKNGVEVGGLRCLYVSGSGHWTE